MIYKRASSIDFDLPRSRSFHVHQQRMRGSTFIERLESGEDSEFSSQSSDREKQLEEQRQQQDQELQDMVFDLIEFKPENKVQLGRKKLMKGRHRKSIFRSHTCIGFSNSSKNTTNFLRETSAFQIADPGSIEQSGHSSRRITIVPDPRTESMKGTQGAISSEKQRCKVALKYLHKCVARLKHLEAPPLKSERKPVQDDKIYESDEESKESKSRSKSRGSDDLSLSFMNDLIRQTSMEESFHEVLETVRSSKSAFSQYYYRHLSNLLEEYLAEDDEVHELRQCASLSPHQMGVPRLTLPFSKTLNTRAFRLIECERESESSETESSKETEEIVLNFTRKLKHQNLRHSLTSLPEHSVNWRDWYK